MVKKVSRRGACATGAAALLGGPLLRANAQGFVPYPSQPYDTAGGEWKTYGGNLSSWRYSALDQINAGNFSRLEPPGPSIQTIWARCLIPICRRRR